MKPSHLAAVVLVASLVCAFANESMQLPVPLLLWGGSSSSTQHVVSSQRVSHLSDIIQVLRPLLAGERKPEVLVAYVAPQLSTAAASLLFGGYSGESNTAFQNLKAAFTSAENGVSLSVDTEGGRMTEVLSALVVAPNAGGRLIPASTSQCSALMSQLASDQTIFTSGKTDLILVSYDDADMAANDACLKQVSDYLAQHAQGRFVSLFTADTGATIQGGFPAVSRQNAETVLLERRSKFALQAIPDGPGVGVLYITPNILLGLLLFLVLLFLTFVGICALDSIQTPLRFPTRRLAVGKEY